jgi:uncharacterized lipoprotein NlpE involved in copper resistance
MKYIISALLTIGGVFVIVGCNQQSQVNATIFERKEIDSGNLLIKYRYIVDGQDHTDSAIISNQVIGSDSITIKISKTSPKTSIPLLEK